MTIPLNSRMRAAVSRLAGRRKASEPERPLGARGTWEKDTRTSIRFRLALAVALALSPVLALGALQAGLGFAHDADARRVGLTQAALRSAAGAQARMEGAAALLETLTPQTVGFECAGRLANLLDHARGYENFIRFSAQGRVQCAAASVRADPMLYQSTWFTRLREGEPVAIAIAPRTVSVDRPSVLAAMRATGADGQFDGALVALMSVDSLKPNTSDPSLGAGVEVALLDNQGRLAAASDLRAFAPPPQGWLSRAVAPGGYLYDGRDRKGEARLQAVAPLVGDDLFVVLSEPAPMLLSWARLNALSSIVLPLLAWLLAWGAVALVSDRVMIRWLSYLDRIAAIYAKGRFSVRPVQAETAPTEIRALAQTLDIMADTILARDAALHEALAEKDSLMREIHHRVKNNLQVITSLLNMQQRALKDPAAREAMSDTRQRITALALIYRALYQSADLRQVDVRSFLEELIAHLTAGEGGRPSPVRTELVADDLEIDPDKLAPLALFAVEAITNARKHAFDNAEGGLIRIGFHVSEAEVVLEVSDDGRGPPPEPGEAGVGRTLMSAFARQLRGQMETTAGVERGLTVRLAFPRPDPAPAVQSPFQLSQR